MRILVDTSVWSTALRRRNNVLSKQADELRGLIKDHRVDMIGPIRQELLSGIRETQQFKRLEKYLSPFPDLPIVTDDYIIAAKFSNICRAKGVQGSNTDFLICAIAVRNDLSIFTTDKDFVLFSKYIPVNLYTITEE